MDAHHCARVAGLVECLMLYCTYHMTGQSARSTREDAPRGRRHSKRIGDGPIIKLVIRWLFRNGGQTLALWFDYWMDMEWKVTRISRISAFQDFSRDARVFLDKHNVNEAIGEMVVDVKEEGVSFMDSMRSEMQTDHGINILGVDLRQLVANKEAINKEDTKGGKDEVDREEKECLIWNKYL